MPRARTDKKNRHEGETQTHTETHLPCARRGQRAPRQGAHTTCELTAIMLGAGRPISSNASRFEACPPRQRNSKFRNGRVTARTALTPCLGGRRLRAI